jgi:hypothetical protein
MCSSASWLRQASTRPGRQGGGVTADDAHPAVQPDERREARGTGRAARIQLERHDLTAAASCQEARGAAQAGAEVQHARVPADARQAGQGVHRRQAAVVVLVEVEQVVGGERRGVERAAPTAHGREHLGLADRVPVVEIDDRVHGLGR